MLFFVFVRGNYFCNVFTVRYIQCRYLFSIEERWDWRAFRLAGSAVHFVRWRWKRKTSCPIAWSLLQRGDTVGKIMLISRSVVIFCHLFCLNIRGLALHWILWFPHEQINGDVIVVTPESLSCYTAGQRFSNRIFVYNEAFCHCRNHTCVELVIE